MAFLVNSALLHSALLAVVFGGCFRNLAVMSSGGNPGGVLLSDIARRAYHDEWGLSWYALLLTVAGGALPGRSRPHGYQ